MGLTVLCSLLLLIVLAITAGALMDSRSGKAAALKNILVVGGSLAFIMLCAMIIS